MSTPNKPGGKALFTPCRRIGLSRNYKSPVLSPRVTQSEDNPTSNIPINGIYVESRSPNLSQNRRMGLSRNYKRPLLSPRVSQVDDNPTSNIPISDNCIESRSPNLSQNRRMGLSRNYKSPLLSPRVSQVEEICEENSSPNLSQNRSMGLSRNYKSPLLSPRVSQVEDNPTPNIPISDICAESSSPNVSQNTSSNKLVDNPAATECITDEKSNESCANKSPLSTPCKLLGFSKVSESPVMDETKNTSRIKWKKNYIIYNDVCKTPPNKKLSLVRNDEIPNKTTQLNIDDLVPVTKDKTLNSKESSEYQVLSGPSTNKIIIKRKRLSLKLHDTSESQELVNLRSNVQELDETIKEKEKTLSKLQQCAVYKQSKDLSSLTMLTETWKTGCELALRRVFANIKGTSDINMDTLLMRLNVPKDLLQYNSESDEFTWILI